MEHNEFSHFFENVFYKDSLEAAQKERHQVSERLKEAERLLRKISDLYHSPPCTARKVLSHETMAEIDEWLLAE